MEKSISDIIKAKNVQYKYNKKKNNIKRLLSMYFVGLPIKSPAQIVKHTFFVIFS